MASASKPASGPGQAAARGGQGGSEWLDGAIYQLPQNANLDTLPGSGQRLDWLAAAKVWANLLLTTLATWMVPVCFAVAPAPGVDLALSWSADFLAMMRSTLAPAQPTALMRRNQRPAGPVALSQ